MGLKLKKLGVLSIDNNDLPFKIFDGVGINAGKFDTTPEIEAMIVVFFS